jgi:hypothetical protein
MQRRSNFADKEQRLSFIDACGCSRHSSSIKRDGVAKPLKVPSDVQFLARTLRKHWTFTRHDGLSNFAF